MRSSEWLRRIAPVLPLAFAWLLHGCSMPPAAKADAAASSRTAPACTVAAGTPREGDVSAARALISQIETGPLYTIQAALPGPTETVFRGEVCNCQARIRRGGDGRVVGLLFKSTC